MPDVARGDFRAMSTGSPRQAGFTLLEVLVALAILSLAVVACIEGFAQGLRLLRLSGNYQQAILLADQKVREIVETREGREEGTEGLFRWERTLKVLEAPDLAPADTVPVWRVWEIDVRVNWDASRHLEVRTLRMVPTAAADPAVPAARGPNRGPGSRATGKPAR